MRVIVQRELEGVGARLAVNSAYRFAAQQVGLVRRRPALRNDLVATPAVG